ncbi:MAG: lipopolysaccharide kinase InaA family protein [Victivallales bacterium]|jgi:heptose I phosphotransferase
MQIKVEHKDGDRLLFNADFAKILEANGINSFEDLWNMPGEAVKNVLRERGTERVFLKSPEGSAPAEAYIKRYRPEPFMSRLKNVLSLRPVRFPGAMNEWEAVIAFHRRNLPTMQPLACGAAGGDSCILTLGITDYVRASELFAKFAKGERERRRKLIRRIAELAAGMHLAKMAHQDFYLVHIFVKEKEDDSVFLIDLQRVIFEESFSERWRVKDLAQLLFSADKLVGRTDILYFWRIYTDMAGGELYRDGSLVNKISRKAARIRRHVS